MIRNEVIDFNTRQFNVITGAINLRNTFQTPYYLAGSNLDSFRSIASTSQLQ